MIACLKVKRREDNQTFFTKNGGRLLEELITFCNGKSNPIRHFSAKELLRPTNCYNTSQIFVEGRGYKLYKGSLKDRPIFVKKYDNHSLLGDFATKDIAIGSQMSVHKNVLKFGMLLIELLSGQQASYLMLEHETLDLGQLCVEELINATDSRIKNEGTYITEQLLDFAALLLRCISSDEEKRPTMIEVAKELRRIDQSFPSPC
ncbi:hypothetical protein SCA6_003177 [Theobroma cacao]